MNEKAFPPTQQRLMEFIRKQFKPGYNHYNVSKLIGDASARQYFRYGAESGDSYILAVYPESFDPERFPYRQVYDLLLEIGLPVPLIETMDGNLGIVLQEDLGNVSLQKHFLSAPGDRPALLRRAIRHIHVIQERGPSALQPHYEARRAAFDEEKLNWELRFFRRNYLEGYRGYDAARHESLTPELNAVASELASAPRFLCHRDYHVRNLMIKDDRLYIIDFQDARWGPPSYDLVSLLKDSIDVGPEEVSELVEFYLEGTGLSIPRREFERQFHLMTVQRLLKALGTYGYQIVERGHFLYEQYVGGSLHRTLLALEALDGFPTTRRLVESELSR